MKTIKKLKKRDTDSSSATWLQPPCFLQHLKVGDFVLVRCEGELYPGRIIQFEENGEVLISASNWKWPSTPDQLPYSKDEIVQQIHEPEQIGRREIFKVKELQVYSDLLATVDNN